MDERVWRLPGPRAFVGDIVADDLVVFDDRLARLTLLGREVGVVNICSGEPRSMQAIVERGLRDKDWRITSRLGRYPYPDYEPFAFWGSAEKLRELFNDKTV